MSDPDEREHYEALLTSPGWLLLSAWAKEEFNTQLSDLVAKAANESNDTVALTKLRQVVAARDAVRFVLEYPSQRVKHLRGETDARQQVTLSRRGPL